MPAAVNPFVWLADVINGILIWALDTVQVLDPVLRTLFAGFGMSLETSVLIGLLVPGDTIVIIASTAVANPVEYVGLLVAVVVGALTGETVGFLLGRFFGPRIRASRLGQRIGEHNWRRAEQYLARRGGIAVFVSRFLPVLHSLIPLTVGMSAMRYRTFMAWTVPACIIWALAYVTVGTLAAGSFRELLTSVKWAGYVFVGIIVLFLALMALAKKLLERAEARHLAEREPPAEQP